MLFQRSLNRIGIWVGRYLPAELGGITGALLSAWAIAMLTGNTPMAALAASWADMVIYYAVIIVRDLRAGTHRSARATLRHMALEFGPAELLDSLLIRRPPCTSASQSPPILPLALSPARWPPTSAFMC